MTILSSVWFPDDGNGQKPRRSNGQSFAGAAPAHSTGRSYDEGELVRVGSLLYMAGADVSVGAFNAEEWTQVGSGASSVSFPAHDDGATYALGDGVLQGGVAYIAPGPISAGTFDAGDWIQASGEGGAGFVAHNPSNAYTVGQGVIQGGVAYIAPGLVAAGTFDAADWIQVSNEAGDGISFPAFSAAESYALGEAVSQGGRYFVAPGAISAGAFDRADWIEVQRVKFSDLGSATPDAVLAIDFTAANVYSADTANSVSFTFANAVRGDRVVVYLEQGGSGSWVLGFPANAEVIANTYDPILYTDAFVVIECQDDSSGSEVFTVAVYGSGRIETLISSQTLDADVDTFFSGLGDALEANDPGKRFSIAKDLELYRRPGGVFRFTYRASSGASQIGTDIVWEQTSNPIESVESVDGFKAISGQGQIPNFGGVCLSALAAQELSIYLTSPAGTSPLVGVVQANRRAFEALGVTTVGSHGTPGSPIAADQVELYVS